MFSEVRHDKTVWVVLHVNKEDRPVSSTGVLAAFETEELAYQNIQINKRLDLMTCYEQDPSLFAIKPEDLDVQGVETIWESFLYTQFEYRVERIGLFANAKGRLQ